MRVDARHLHAAVDELAQGGGGFLAVGFALKGAGLNGRRRDQGLVGRRQAVPVVLEINKTKAEYTWRDKVRCF